MSGFFFGAQSMVKTQTAARAAKAVVLDQHGRLLLLRRALDDRQGPGEWDLPGGRIEQTESLEHGLVREVLEETGLAITPGPQIARWRFTAADGSEVTGTTFLAAHDAVKPVLSAEHDTALWLSFEEACERPLSQALRRDLRMIAARFGRPR